MINIDLLVTAGAEREGGQGPAVRGSREGGGQGPTPVLGGCSLAEEAGGMATVARLEVKTGKGGRTVTREWVHS